MSTDPAITKATSEQITPAEHTRTGDYYRPNVDILEKEDELLVQADVPGATKEQLDIEFEDGVLTIRARVEPRQPEGTTFLRREFGVGDFYRTFQVGETVDAGAISAELSGGVLTLHLPKTEQVRRRKIEVKSA